MGDEDKDARRVGRDEMNLAEFPITLLADRVPEGCKTLVFEDRHGKLTVVGSEDLGLPTAPDSDVIVALLHLTKLRNDFTDLGLEPAEASPLQWERRKRLLTSVIVH